MKRSIILIAAISASSFGCEGSSDPGGGSPSLEETSMPTEAEAPSSTPSQEIQQEPTATPVISAKPTLGTSISPEGFEISYEHPVGAEGRDFPKAKSLAVTIRGQGHTLSSTHDPAQASTVALHKDGEPLPDGLYKYHVEARMAETVTPAHSKEIDARGRPVGSRPGPIPPPAQEGTFRIQDGVPADLSEQE